MTNNTKYKLEDFIPPDDCVLIGIISAAPAYNLCWHLNKQLEIEMFRCPDIRFEMIQKLKKYSGPDLFRQQDAPAIEDKSFSFHQGFKYHDESLYTNYYLIANKGTKVNLEPSLKKVNYFFEIEGNQSQYADRLIFELNNIEPISMAYIVGNDSIINKMKLII